ncbi:hypothetical protein HDU97_002109 [Phlyctochytrium planicorne]|nr:hypothetical protein HDU97_002109 [Phlyctochytrium planicorne]
MSLDCPTWIPLFGGEAVLQSGPGNTSGQNTIAYTPAPYASSSSSSSSSSPESQGILLAVVTANVDCIPIESSYQQNVQSFMDLQDKLPFLPYDIVAFQEVFENLIPPSDPEIIRLATQPSLVSRFTAFWKLFRTEGIKFATHKRRTVEGYYGFGTARQLNPLTLDSGLMTYSRFPMVSKRFLRFRAQTDAISRGALFCVVKLPTGQTILHINVHFSPSLARNAIHIRSLQIDELCDHVQDTYQNLADRIILMGDLNIEYGSTTRFQQLNVALCARLGLAVIARDRMPRRSFVGNARDPKSELVDYVLVSEGLGRIEEMKAVEVGEGAFGDHLPVAATVRVFGAEEV